MKSTLDFKTCKNFAEDIKAVLPVLFLNHDTLIRIADFIPFFNYHNSKINNVSIPIYDPKMIATTVINHHHFVMQSNRKNSSSLTSYSEDREPTASLTMNTEDFILLSNKIKPAQKVMELFREHLNEDEFKMFLAIKNIKSRDDFLSLLSKSKEKRLEEYSIKYEKVYYD